MAPQAIQNGCPTYFFGIPQFKELFPSLSHIADDTLILLFDLLIRLFIKNCVQAQIGITDMYHEPRPAFGGQDQQLVYDGRIVIMQCNFGCLIAGVVPQSDTITGVHFSRVHTPEFIKAFHLFICRQDLDALRSEIADDFSEDLNTDVRKFYSALPI